MPFDDNETVMNCQRDDATYFTLDDRLADARDRAGTDDGTRAMPDTVELDICNRLQAYRWP